MKVRPAAFLFFDAVGATLWAGVGTALGVLFADTVRDVLRAFSELGRWGAIIVLGAVALFVFRKWWQRQRFSRQLKIQRIAAAELAELVIAAEPPLLLDARTVQGWDDGHIDGALTVHDPSWSERLGNHPKAAPLVVYCDCPNDASAVVAARKLMKQGYTNVRPLAGGLDAWVAHGGRLVADPPSTGSKGQRVSVAERPTAQVS